MALEFRALPNQETLLSCEKTSGGKQNVWWIGDGKLNDVLKLSTRLLETVHYLNWSDP
jgi:hypothetical protein